MVKIATKHTQYEVEVLGSSNLYEISQLILTKVHSQQYIILTESGVPSNIFQDIQQEIVNNGKSCHLICLQKIGEGNKTFNILENALSNIFQNVKLTRDTVLIAIGGGTIGDLGGFIASILMRGIKFVQVPTTLLAMVDSSIGGKTGINGFGYKNIIGTFYQPDYVICNPGFLDTLSYDEYISGYAEILKHAIISNYHPDLLNNLLTNEQKIISKDKHFLHDIITKSCSIKADIVAKDENETLGIRTFLNFGHTIAHAIEKLDELDGKILHGSAVAIGMLIELKIASALDVLNNKELLQTIENHLKNLSLPTKISTLNSNILQQMLDKMLFDKKNTSSPSGRVKISFALPSDVGRMNNVQVSINELETILKNALS